MNIPDCTVNKLQKNYRSFRVKRAVSGYNIIKCSFEWKHFSSYNDDDFLSRLNGHVRLKYAELLLRHLSNSSFLYLSDCSWYCGIGGHHHVCIRLIPPCLYIRVPPRLVIMIVENSTCTVRRVWCTHWVGYCAKSIDEAVTIHFDATKTTFVFIACFSFIWHIYQRVFFRGYSTYKFFEILYTRLYPEFHYGLFETFPFCIRIL